MYFLFFLLPLALLYAAFMCWCWWGWGKLGESQTVEREFHTKVTFIVPVRN